LAIYHKIGEVPVGFASVTIVAVSPHRKYAIEVAAIAIE
jgi:molybdopterin synthase catalytic subunit